ncbi:SRPBCC family protein [Variovorax sp. J22P168]|uniref:SRPBCC family protein n=1 Tax=Variovorax jilinensis TaxID=3053513 RepID=UPI0025763C54|nr:SRPBCC family protein [Variovorax sp. J22P168]MDM0013834.1 SRPBCC family protein [Variovorax sp. J22P168]
MAAIRQEIRVSASADAIWDAVRDVGQIHRRLVPGFVTDCRLEGDARIVTFANGMVARELIVSVDDAARRTSWSATGGPLTHHNASLQVISEGETESRLVWVADLLPNEMAASIAAMIEAGMQAMKRTLEGASAP